MTVGVLTGGGDTPALNAVLYGIVSALEENGNKAIGFLRGWAGVLDSDREYLLEDGKRLDNITGEYVNLKSGMINPQQGGTILMSSRTNLPKVQGGLEDAVKNISRMCDALIAIGGDDTITVMREVIRLLGEDVPVNGVTKTIDNDAGINAPDGAEADYSKIISYFTPGFITAVVSGAKYVRDLRTTAYSHERFVFVEAMGRKPGWLALGHYFAKPDLIVIPEYPLDKEHFVSRAIEIYKRQGYLVGVIAEGARWRDTGKEIARDESKSDSFGNVKLKGAAGVIAGIIEQETKKIGLNAPNSNSVIPEYLYRGGSPTKQDMKLSIMLGKRVAGLTARERSGQIAVLSRIQESLLFNAISLPIERVVEFENGSVKPRRVDPRFYNPENYCITGQGIEYFSPIEIKIAGFTGLDKGLIQTL